MNNLIFILDYEKILKMTGSSIPLHQYSKHCQHEAQIKIFGCESNEWTIKRKFNLVGEKNESNYENVSFFAKILRRSPCVNGPHPPASKSKHSLFIYSFIHSFNCLFLSKKNPKSLNERGSVFSLRFQICYGICFVLFCFVCLQVCFFVCSFVCFLFCL